MENKKPSLKTRLTKSLASIGTAGLLAASALAPQNATADENYYLTLQGTVTQLGYIKSDLYGSQVSVGDAFTIQLAIPMSELNSVPSEGQTYTGSATWTVTIGDFTDSFLQRTNISTNNSVNGSISHDALVVETFPANGVDASNDPDAAISFAMVFNNFNNNGDTGIFANATIADLVALANTGVITSDSWGTVDQYATAGTTALTSVRDANNNYGSNWERTATLKVDSLAVTPEPSTVALLGAGAAALLSRLYRRRKNGMFDVSFKNNSGPKI